MPFFRYTATDSSGQRVQGTMQAADAQDVTHRLVQRGFGSVQIVHPQAPTAQPPSPQPTTGAQIRTKPASDKLRYFLFSQLARLAASGVPLVQALQTLATQSQHPGMAQALTDLARQASTGGSLAEGMGRYPDLFPRHVVATVQSGELGGFLPEALAAISDQAGSSSHFRRFHWWVWFILANAVLTVPFVYQVSRVLLNSWDKIDSTGGAGGVGGALGTMQELFWQSVLWPYGPLSLVAWLLIGLGLKWFFSLERARFRHRIGLAIPIVGKRGMYESLSVFNWVLSKLSNSGLAPQACWNLAAESVPNLEIAERLKRVGATLGEQSKLSEGFAKERIFPGEYASIVATGEMVGDVPGTLAKMAETSRTEFIAQTHYARLRTGCWGALVLFATVGAILAILMYMWYQELPAKILEGLDV